MGEGQPKTKVVPGEIFEISNSLVEGECVLYAKVKTCVAIDFYETIKRCACRGRLSHIAALTLTFILTLILTLTPTQDDPCFNVSDEAKSRHDRFFEGRKRTVQVQYNLKFKRRIDGKNCWLGSEIDAMPSGVSRTKKVLMQVGPLGGRSLGRLLGC